MSVHFLGIFVVGLFHTCDRASLKRVSFFDQFIHAFRIRFLGAGQSFKIF